jgi:undecaprenyl-diphosphatase
LFFNAIIIAIIEGITEFLPISSTGHMILVEDKLTLHPEAFADTFMVAIQLPAVLAVALLFWKDLCPKWNDRADVGRAFRLWLRIVVAFLPAAVIGFLLDDLIDKYLFTPSVVAAALIVGGVILIWLERRKRASRFDAADRLPFSVAVGIGFFQCLAMIPGTSRSAATIIGAMLLGANRPTAAQFSFYLAIPTMVGATGLKLMKSGASFSAEQWMLLGVGSLVSFVTAWIVVAGFIRYIRKHDFQVFGYYRIVLGVVVFVWLGARTFL